LGIIEFTNEIMLEVHNIQGCHVEIHGEICNDFGMTQNSIANSAHTRNKSNKLSTRAVCMQLHNCTIILCSVASSIEE